MNNGMSAVCFLALLWHGGAMADSLFDPQTFKPVGIDYRASEVGDVLTIVVNEISSASANSSAATNTQVRVGASASDGTNSFAGNVNANNAFDGGGVVKRRGEFQARVAVVVQSILPNGDLWVTGAQLIEFNEEKQQISVEGRVRRADISSQNTVYSSRLAESKIRYKGEGILSKSESPGLITRFFDWLF